MASKRSHETAVEDMATEDYFLSRYYDSSQDEFFSKFRHDEIVAAVRNLSPSLSALWG